MAHPKTPPASFKHDAALAARDSISLSQKTIFFWLPILYLLVSSAFYLRTYDSAQVKITLVQMGGVCLVGLWLCRLAEEGFLKAFRTKDIVVLAPFLAFLASGIMSFIFAPYHASSTDFFIRRVAYMVVALIVVQEFNSQAIARTARILIWSAWIATVYGFIQWFDNSYFPRGIGAGVDPFIWRGAFGTRVFSTYGNPNFFADYLVIMFPIIVCQYLRTHDFKLLVLLALDVFNLWGTETKGAWIGFVISASLLGFTYLYFFAREKLREYKLHLIGTLLLAVSIVGFGVFNKLSTSRFTSVNFRLFTWEATWEMIMTQKWTGTSIGSFWVIYPAFRRPPIFHIEGKHNTETDHSENEYLEVLYDEGIIGFGIFIWLLVASFTMAYRSLAQLTGSVKAGERAPPRAYDLLGYLIAFQGMLAHNFFDVSMRFVSSGVYLGLLSGVIVNLSRGTSLSESHESEPAAVAGDGDAPWRKLTLADFSAWTGRLAFCGAFVYLVLAQLKVIAWFPWLNEIYGAKYALMMASIAALAGLSIYNAAWALRLAAWASVFFAAMTLITQFADLQGPLYQMRSEGEKLQWSIAWTVFLFMVVGIGLSFARIVHASRSPAVALIIIVMMYPLNKVWGFFKADVKHNVAIFFSKQQNWEQALRHYLEVGKLNPAFIMSFYFKGNVFNDRFNMSKIYNPGWGDENNVARDDFQRAYAAYEEVRARAPNYVQMHHQVGVLHMKHGDWLMQQGKQAEGQAEWDKALERFQMYRNIDPVFAPNYHRMGHIFMSRKQYDKAIAIYKALIDADECRVDHSLSDNEKLRKTILAYQEYVQEDGKWVHRHASGEAFVSLGNAYFLSDNLGEAEKSYKKALALEPGNANAQRNLQGVYQRAQQTGRMKGPMPAVPGAALPPSFEPPSKH